MDSKATTKSLGNGVTSTTTLPLVDVIEREKPVMMRPNDTETTQSWKKIRVSADEALEKRSDLSKNKGSSDLELHSNISRAVEDVFYESDDDGGVLHDARSATKTSSRSSFGRWTREEHEAFLLGLKEYGREWKKVADMIPTRSSAQVCFCRKHILKKEDTLVFNSLSLFFLFL